MVACGAGRLGERRQLACRLLQGRRQQGRCQPSGGTERISKWTHTRDEWGLENGRRVRMNVCCKYEKGLLARNQMRKSMIRCTGLLCNHLPYIYELVTQRRATHHWVTLLLHNVLLLLLLGEAGGALNHHGRVRPRVRHHWRLVLHLEEQGRATLEERKRTTGMRGNLPKTPESGVLTIITTEVG